MKKTKLKGNLLLLLTAVIWGTSFIAQSKGVELISAAEFNGIRSMLGGLVLLPIAFIVDYAKKRQGIFVQRVDKELILSGILCGILLCFASTFQTAGLVYTSPGKAGFITALYMIFIPIIGLFKGKKPTAITWSAVGVATIGLYMICVNDGFTVNKGDILVLISSVLFTGQILAVDYYAPRVDGIKLSILQFLVCGTLNIIQMFVFEKPSIQPILDCIPTIIYSGIMSCGVAYTLQIIGQKYTDPTSASILMSLESVFATLSTVILVKLGMNITGGEMTTREIIGCLLMFIAIITVQLPDFKKGK